VTLDDAWRSRSSPMDAASPDVSCARWRPPRRSRTPTSSLCTTGSADGQRTSSCGSSWRRFADKLAGGLGDGEVAAVGVELLDALASAHGQASCTETSTAERDARRRRPRQGHGLRHRAG